MLHTLRIKFLLFLTTFLAFVAPVSAQLKYGVPTSAIQELYGVPNPNPDQIPIILSILGVICCVVFIPLVILIGLVALMKKKASRPQTK